MSSIFTLRLTNPYTSIRSRGITISVQNINKVHAIPFLTGLITINKTIIHTKIMF